MDPGAGTDGFRGLSFLSAGILVAASIQFIAAVPHAPFLEFSVTESGIRKKILARPFEQRGGYVEVPQAPRLEIELDPEVIRRYGFRLDLN